MQQVEAETLKNVSHRQKRVLRELHLAPSSSKIDWEVLYHLTYFFELAALKRVREGRNVSGKVHKSLTAQRGS